jgi:hypothetical protein
MASKSSSGKDAPGQCSHCQQEFGKRDKDWGERGFGLV